MSSASRLASVSVVKRKPNATMPPGRVEGPPVNPFGSIILCSL
jgi:hypothetical protein